MLRKILLICGILSSLLYVAMNVFIAMQWESYNSASQTISELSAIDAPTRAVWVLLGFVYTFLVIAFGYGIWKSASGNRLLRIVGLLMIINGVISIAWPLAPMHQREVLAAGGGTFSDTMHIVLSMATVLLFLLSIGFGAAALGKGFRLYSIATIIVLLAFGILTGLDAPLIEKNLPTPWIGVWERINIGVYMLWVIVLSIILLKMGKTASTLTEADNDNLINEIAGNKQYPERERVSSL